MNLDALAISETWLTPKTKEWGVGGFSSFRIDRKDEKRGGRTLILFKNAYKVEILNLQGRWNQFIEVAGVKLQSTIGQIYLISVYAPSNSGIRLEIILELLNKIPAEAHVILTGDFNAHPASHSPYKLNDMGKIVLDMQDTRGLILINDDTPTYSPNEEEIKGSVLDLYLVSDTIAGLVHAETLIGVDTSDHFPIELYLPMKIESLCGSSGRICVRKETGPMLRIS